MQPAPSQYYRGKVGRGVGVGNLTACRARMPSQGTGGWRWEPWHGFLSEEWLPVEVKEAIWLPWMEVPLGRVHEDPCWAAEGTGEKGIDLTPVGGLKY